MTWQKYKILTFWFLKTTTGVLNRLSYNCTLTAFPSYSTLLVACIG